MDSEDVKTSLELENRAIAAYNRYSDSVGGLNYQGLPMPTWAGLTDKIRAAWIAAITVPDQPAIEFAERDVTLIALSKDYAAKYQGAGAPGHGSFLLIAKLAQALGL